MTTGLWVLVGAVVLVLAVGGWRAVVDGRFGSRRAAVPQEPGRPEAGPTTVPTTWEQVAAAAPGVAPGERATLVQFSTAFCAPCRATRRTLTEVAELVPGVVHIEVDAEQHLDVVRRLDVLRTPTTLVLDASGREVSRAAGAPRKEQVLGALAAVD
ncbi:thioredoxin family protein [Nocardioides marmotae]|uniref:thioredoxin family protein n=1 Tax=Nocardioides marmotae TaxID=2663857 RepID=UPI0012B54AD0|nr:thioredoxin family protein [Nocardioides marmotae]MBC9732734.1 thioredoxin family protein [Nocardioides marmotae]MTB83851.1 thioredoxin [Nocardioides marmotae]